MHPMRDPRTLVFFSIILLLATSSVFAQSDIAELRNSVVKDLRRQWESIETLAFKSNHEPIDQNHDPKPDGVWDYFECALGSGGRRAIKVSKGKKDRPQVIMENMRQDGQLHYRSIEVPQHEELLDRILISNQQDSHEDYQGVSCCALWLLTPGGRPLYSFLADKKTKILAADDSPNTRTITLSGFHKEYPLEIELDGNHDWSASRIKLGDPCFMDVIVTKFARQAGMWFCRRRDLSFAAAEWGIFA